MPQMTVVQRAGDVATRPFVALVGMRGRGGHDDTARQESALAGSSAQAVSNGATVANGLDHHDHDTQPEPLVTRNGNGNAQGSVAARTNGAPAAAWQDAAANGNRSRPVQHPTDPPAVRAEAGPTEPKHELSPRASHEDAMRRARELRERQRKGADEGTDRS